MKAFFTGFHDFVFLNPLLFQDSQKMPPPKFGPIKKRKSKRSIDFGKVKSAPTTPTERSPIKEEAEHR